MKVPCIKGYKLTERDSLLNEIITGRKVTIYNNVCDSYDLCRDESCDFYDDTESGTQKFNEGMVEFWSSIDGIKKDELNKKRFHRLYGIDDSDEEDDLTYLKIIHKHNPRLIQEFLDNYCRENNLPLEEFNGDFKELQNRLTKEGKLKVIIPKDMMRNI